MKATCKASILHVRPYSATVAAEAVRAYSANHWARHHLVDILKPRHQSTYDLIHPGALSNASPHKDLLVTPNNTNGRLRLHIEVTPNQQDAEENTSTVTFHEYIVLIERRGRLC